MLLNYFKTKIFFVFTLFLYFSFNPVFAEYECIKWDTPDFSLNLPDDSKWKIRLNADSWGASSDGVWWIIKPNAKQPQILSPSFSALSNNCYKIHIRYSVTGGGSAIARAYFDVGNGNWQTYYIEKWVTMDGNARSLEFIVPTEARGKFTRILFDLFDSDNWKDRTVYVNNIVIYGETPICNYSLSSYSKNIDHQSYSGSFKVNTSSGCQWSASENYSWLKITSGSSGSSSDYIYYQVDENTNTSSRTGKITVAGNTFTVNQAKPPQCNYSLSSYSKNIDHKSYSGSFKVNTSSGCQWSASENYSWLKITSGSSGSSSGYIYYQVDENTNTSSRTGKITVAGNSFTIDQEGKSLPPCTYSVNSTYKKINYQYNTGSISVTSPSHCSWNVSSSTSWLQVTSASSGSGNGTVNYKVLENTTSNIRTGKIYIKNKTITIEQEAKPIEPGRLIKIDDNLPTSIPPLGGSYWIKIKNDGESSINIYSTSPNWVYIAPSQGNISGGESETIIITVYSIDGSDSRSGKIDINSSNGNVSKNIIQQGLSTELVIDNIKIKGDEIAKQGDKYELSGNIKIGHIRGSYVASIPDARAEIDFNAQSVNIFDNQNFDIIDSELWKFRQTTWNINCAAGNAHIKTQLGLSNIGFIEFDGIINFESISFTGKSHFSGAFEEIGQVNFSINFQTPSVALSVQTGKSFEVWPLKLDILDSSAGFKLNLNNNEVSIEINADLNVLELGFVDGSIFFSPFSGNKINLKWDGLQNRLIFTGDTEISLPLSMVKKYFDEEMLEELGYNNIKKSIRKKIVNIGIIVKENSFVDFDDASFHLNCSLAAQATDDIEIKIDPIELGLDWNNKKFFGQLGVEENILPFLTAKGGTSFDFNWASSDFTLIGDFVVQLWIASIDLNAGLQFHYQGSKYLKGWTQSKLKFLKWEISQNAEFYIFSDRFVINGSSITFPWKSINSNPYNMRWNFDLVNERIDGNIITPFNIPDTTLSLDANSYFILNQDESALIISSVYKGIDLKWKILPDPFTVDLVKKQGIILSTASNATMRVQSKNNPERYIELKPTGEFLSNNMDDMLFSCIRTKDPGTNQIWKVISINPQNRRQRSLEDYIVILNDIQSNNELNLTYIQSNNSQARTTETTRFVVYNNEQLTAGKTYSTTIGERGNVSPLISDDGQQSIENIFYDVATISTGLSFENINAKIDGDEYVIDVSLNQAANCIMYYGENENSFVEPVISDSGVIENHQFRIPQNNIHDGWVYKVKAFVDDKDVVYSGVYFFPSLVEKVDLEDGLVAYYPFNGNANDESGNGNHGAVNGASLTKDRFDNENNAYSFDGIDDFIEVQDDDSLDLNNMTISAWINPNNFPDENYSGILCKDEQTKHSSFCTSTTKNSLRFSAFFEDASYNQPEISGHVDLNMWQHIVYVLKNGEIKIYKNNQSVLNNTSSKDKILNKNNEPLYIGRTYWFPGKKLSINYFAGVIDDIRIYNRAISVAEIKALYEIQPSILSVTPTYQEVPATNGTTIFEVSSNLNWTATTTDSWLTIQTNNNTITTSHEANTGEARIGKITVTAESASNNPQIVEISQESGIIDLGDGLVAYYPFNGNANDESGNENHGSVNGNLQYENGVEDKSAKFDGKNYVRIIKPKSLNSVETMTICYWLKYYKPVSGSGDMSATLWNKSRTLFTYAGSSNISHHLSKEPENNSVSVNIPMYAKIPLNSQQFHLISFVVTEDKLRSYKNAELISESDKKDKSISKLTGDWFIGQSGSNTYYLNGYIDELRIYDRVLKESELIQLYRQGIKTTYPFTEIQSLPVGGYNCHIESFNIDDKTFLAVGNGSSAKIYQWNNESFINFQTFETYSASQIVSFSINDIKYLAISNRGSSSNFTVDSNIYKWNGVQFELHQAIKAYDCLGLDYFKINDDSFLVFSNYRDNKSGTNISAQIYKWSEDSFQLFQKIPTNGAIRSKYFTIDEDKFLAIGNHYPFNQNSKIYKWNGSTFQTFQNIPTSGVWDIESFSINNNRFLAIANSFNGTSNDINSFIYQWDGEKFIEFQTILTHGAADWEYFNYNNNSYLVVANSDNYYRSNQDFSTSSILYKWDGHIFKEIQDFNLYRNFDWESFNINDEIYLAGSSSNETKIYKWNYDLAVTPIAREIPSTKGSTTFKVTSDLNWTTTTFDSWLTIETVDDKIIVNYKENSSEARTGNIIVSAEGTSNSPQIIEVRQESGLVDLEDGLMAYYPFNGNANDESGNGNYGVLKGNPSFVNSKFNKSIYLSSEGDYIELSNPLLADKSKWSVCAWIKIKATSSSEDAGHCHPIYGEFSSSWTTKNFIVLNQSKLEEGGIFIPGFDNYPNKSGPGYDAPYKLNPNQWYFITYIRENNVISFYINDKLFGKETYEEYTGGKISKVFIGYRDLYTNHKNYWYSGEIDELRFYDRILSKAEIMQLFQVNDDLKSELVIHSTFHKIPATTGIISFNYEYTGSTQIEIQSNSEWLSTSSDIDSITVSYDSNSGDERIGTITILASGTNVSQTVSFIQETNEINLEEGLIAYYPFNGNSNDESGNNNHGVVNGDATLTEDRFGNSDEAYSFDGNGDYIRIKDNDLFEVTNVKTISVWVKKIGSRGIYSNYSIVAKYKSDTPNESGWYFVLPTQNDITYITGSYKGIVNLSGFEIDLNNWYFLTLTLSKYKSQYKLELFINGLKVDEGNGYLKDESYLKENSNDMLIGACFGNWGGPTQYSYFYGNIDDLRLYNRTLNQTEIRALYEMNQYKLTVKPTFHEVPSIKGTTTFEVNPNLEWTATTSDSWLTIEKSEDSLVVNYESNTSEARTGKITITSEGSSNSPQTVEIRQDKYENETPPASHFQTAWQGNPIDSMKIWLISKSFETLDLSPGDEIAVFDGDVCVGARNVDSTIDDSFNIITSKADDNDPGFKEGHQISFRVWDASEQIEICNIAGSFFELSGEATDNNTFKPNADVAVSLYFSTVSQTINLNAGWNIISFYVEPEMANMIDLFQGLIDDDALYKIIDEKGQRLIYNAFSKKWVNEIGNMNNEEGYQVKVKKDVELTIKGEKVQVPFEIPLSKGWNIFGWPIENSISVMNVIQPLIDNNVLIKVIDEQGRRIIYNAFSKKWVNEIGKFEPGKGFLIKVKEDTSLSINKVEQKSRKRKLINKSQKITNGNLCSPVWSGNPYNSLKFWIVEVGNFVPEENDEICVFDGDKCVGMGIVTQGISYENILTIVCSEDDGNDSGFQTGNEIVFKIWDSSEGKEITTITPTFMDIGTAEIIEPPPTFTGNSDLGVKLTVISENHAPILTDINDYSIYQNTELIIPISVYDPDGDEITLSAQTSNENVEVTINQSELTITPKTDWFGSDIIITVISTDSGGLADSKTFNLNVNENLQKIIISSNNSGFYGDRVSITITVNNPEKIEIEGFDITIDVDKTVLKKNTSSATLNGSLLEGKPYEITYNKETGQLVIWATNSYRFSESGTIALIEFDIIGSTGSSSPITFKQSLINRLSVKADDGLFIVANSCPVFTKGPDISEKEDTSVNKPYWATNINAGNINEKQQKLTFTLTSDYPELFEQGPAISIDDGTLSYVPKPDAFGTANVTVILTDDGGVQNGGCNISSPQTFKISINPHNDCPGFTKGEDQTVTSSNSPVIIPKWATNISPGPENESDQKVSFYLETDKNDLFEIIPSISDDGSLTFTPKPDQKGQTNVYVFVQDDGARPGCDTSDIQQFTITINRYELSGNISYYYENKPVPNVTLKLEGPYSSTIKSDIYGNFSFPALPPGIYSLIPSKSDDLNGLSGNDATNIAGYAVELEEFSCQQKISADIFSDNKILSINASRVAQFAAGVRDCLTDDNECKHWYFMTGDNCSWPQSNNDSKIEINLNSDKKDISFKAIRIGDVTGSWSPDTKTLSKSLKISDNNTSEIDLFKGSTLSIPILINEDKSIREIREIRGIDLDFTFNQDVIKADRIVLKGGLIKDFEDKSYTVVENTSVNGKSSFVVYTTPPNIYSPKGSEVLVNLDVQAVGQVGSETDLSFIKLHVNENTMTRSGFIINDEIYRSLKIKIKDDPGIDGRPGLEEAIYSLNCISGILECQSKRTLKEILNILQSLCDVE